MDGSSLNPFSRTTARASVVSSDQHRQDLIPAGEGAESSDGDMNTMDVINGVADVPLEHEQWDGDWEKEEEEWHEQKHHEEENLEEEVKQTNSDEVEDMRKWRRSPGDSWDLLYLSAMPSGAS